jgi:hypothetical protein
MGLLYLEICPFQLIRHDTPSKIGSTSQLRYSELRLMVRLQRSVLATCLTYLSKKLLIYDGAHRVSVFTDENLSI